MSTTTDNDILLPKPPGSGLISGAKKANAFSSGVQSQLGSWGMTEDDISTANQVGKVLDANNPLMKQVQGQTDMEFNRRGLGNSSAAVEAGQQAMITKAIDLVNPTIDRVTGMATTDRNNAAAMEREKAQAAAQAGIAAANAAAAMERAKFEAGETSKLADKNFANQLTLTDKNNSFNASLNDKNFANQLALADKSNAAAIARIDKEFGNQLTVINKQIEAGIAAADRDAANTLQTNYRAASGKTYDAWVADVQKIQEADMDDTAKEAHIKNLNTMYSQRQTYVNELYKNSPGWKADWATIAAEFGSAPPKP